LEENTTIETELLKKIVMNGIKKSFGMEDVLENTNLILKN